MNFTKSFIDYNTFLEILENTPFFCEKKIGVPLPDNGFIRTNIYKLKFSKKFFLAVSVYQNTSRGKIRYLDDLLNTDYRSILSIPRTGGECIRAARWVIRIYIHSVFVSSYFLNSQTKYLYVPRKLYSRKKTIAKA